MGESKKKREAAPGVRHRRQSGEVEVKEAPPVVPRDIGTAHEHTEAIIGGGVQALLANDKTAQVLAREHGETFGEDFKAQWTLETDWMLNLRGTERGRAQANYAKQWRPTFLAVVALSHGIILGCRAAGVSDNTVAAHRNADPDFDAQVQAAQAHCIQLLHTVTMRDALEGVLEPIYWQGIRVGHVRKVDNRLRIEMLRAHMPETFKTPGSKLNINTGNQVLGGGGPVGDQEIQDLMAMRQRSLEKIAKARVIEVPQLEVGTDPAAGVPPTP